MRLRRTQRIALEGRSALRRVLATCLLLFPLVPKLPRGKRQIADRYSENSTNLSHAFKLSSDGGVNSEDLYEVDRATSNRRQLQASYVGAHY